MRDAYENFPGLTEHGRRMLHSLRDHPFAPMFRNESGHRLTPEEAEEARAYERSMAGATIGWQPGAEPDWLPKFVRHCCEEVPHYRKAAVASRRFADIKPVSRSDFGRDIAQFVPDSLPLDRMLNYRTSGTSGHPLDVPSHPRVAARYLAFVRRALCRFGIELRSSQGSVAFALVGYQRRCFTYASVSPMLDEAGVVKLNLHPADWRDSGDRARYLDALNPEIISGDPISLAELAGLDMKGAPRAIVSTSMTLSFGLRDRLEKRFSCSVLDLYSLNEVGPVSVWDPNLGGHVVLQPGLYVEILDTRGVPVTAGDRGEITVTGGFNPYLPLLRYRTGDHAALVMRGREPALIGFEGRAPVRFLAMDGTWHNNIEITQLLSPLGFTRFGLHQRADRTLLLRVEGGSTGREAAAQSILETFFGDGQPIETADFGEVEDKVIQYSSDMPEAHG